MSFEAHKVVFEQGPADASEFENLVTSGAIQPDRVAAVIGKTEGNGGVNDFTRILADRAFRDVLRRHRSRDEASVSADPEGVVGRHRRRPPPARLRVHPGRRRAAGLAVGIARRTRRPGCAAGGK